MSGDWKSFGLVAGIFWVRRTGIALRVGGPKFERVQMPERTYWRLWPFVVVRVHS